MATNPVNEIIQHLRSTMLLREGDELTDGQLLERCVSRGESRALEALVRRHGPMVWGVCRRVLRNHHDAEDAFQATFLVFVRKAASIASPKLLANWLYGVAHQTALKARQTAAKRRARERQVTDMPEPEAVEQDHDLWRDLQPLLDEALRCLPDKYRVVLLLCDLEGKSRKEAARRLGLPEGTVGSRLARARTMLAKRLARHGLAMSGGTLAAVLSQKASASVPASVMASTIKAATLLAAGGGAAAGLISAKVAALTEGVLKAMLLMKLKATAVIVLIAGMVLFGGLLTHHMVAAQQGQAEKLLPEASQGDADTHKVGAAPLVQPEKLPRQDKKIADDNHKINAVKTNQAAEVKSVVSGPLSVTLKLQKDRIRIDEPFKVSVRVVNTSRSRQSFQVANGSWEMHWEPSNDRVHWVPRAVFRNFVETVNLDPGQAYEQTGDLFIAPGKPQKEVVFKMGFTPRSSKQTYWSNVVTVQIESGQGG